MDGIDCQVDEFGDQSCRSNPAVAILLVVAGGGGNRRKVAVERFEAGRTPLILVRVRSDALAIVEALETEDGLAPKNLEGEACSCATAENGKYTAQVLMPKAVKRVILVTDPPHMLRSSLILRSVGFEVDHHPVSFPANFSRYRHQVLAASEAVRLTTYALLGRFGSKH